MSDPSSSNGETSPTSLLFHCKPCGSACCLYSSPIVSEDERERIINASGNDLFLRQETPTGAYYVIGRAADGSLRGIDTELNPAATPCGYLAPDGMCAIHALKPMDCRAYPLRAIPGPGGPLHPDWRLHHACPAAPTLSRVFIGAARSIALGSLKRFHPETYLDWLRRYSPWALDDSARPRLEEPQLEEG